MSTGNAQARSVRVLCCLVLIVAAGWPAAAAAGGVPGPGPLPRVRVDLEAGALLDPLPFDRPFLLSGRVPPTVTVVAVELTEYLVEPAFPTSVDLDRFRARLTELLAAALDDSRSGPLADPPRVDALRRQIGALLVAQTTAARRPGLARRALGGVLPWNWDQWGQLLRGATAQVDAPGTLLDLASPAAAAEMADRLARLAPGRGGSVQALAGALTQAARTSCVVVPAPAATPVRPGRWVRLEATGAGAAGGANHAEPAPGWNRLERVRALAGSRAPDRELLAGIGPSPAPKAERDTWTSFDVPVPALEAQRYYAVRFRVERQPTEGEAEDFARQAGALLPAAGAVDPVDRRAGPGLRELLQRSVAAPWGLAPEPSAPRLAAGSAAGALEGGELDAAGTGPTADSLRTRLTGWARQQPLVYTPQAGAATPYGDYISADIGLLYADVIGRSAAYLGANFYLRPLDKAVPLGQRGGFLRRFALTAGVSLNSVEDRRRVRHDLFLDQNLVLGAGYRISQRFRLGGGLLLFREREPASFPLTRRTRLTTTPYLSLSLDAGVGRQLRGLGRLSSL